MGRPQATPRTPSIPPAAFARGRYAIGGIGAVCHTLNPRLFEEDLQYIINHAQVPALSVLCYCAVVCQYTVVEAD